ncbi:MAG: zinc-binding dehydrogenase, partial [Actinomycetes bacterium]
PRGAHPGEFEHLVGAGGEHAVGLAGHRELGADAAVDYTADDWPDRVREAAPNGVDVVLDSVSGEIRRRSFGLLAPFGRVVVYGAASGDIGEIAVTDLFMMHSVAGFSLLAYRAAAPKQAADEVTELTGHFAAGRLRTSVHTRLPLAEVAAAHRILESRANLGRVLLVP